MTDCPLGLDCKTDPCPILDECQAAAKVEKPLPPDDPTNQPDEEKKK